MFAIHPERPGEAAAIESLLDDAFGPGRQAKTAYRFREDVPPVSGLCFTAVEPDGCLVGTVRHWPVHVDPGPAAALLLGPIAVHPRRRGAGIGVELMRTSLTHAQRQGWELVVLVGDEPYYGRFGFHPAARLGLEMADEDPRRVLAQPLGPWAGHGGILRPAGASLAATGSGTPAARRYAE